MIPLLKPVFDKEMEDAAVHSLNNERFVLGESVFKFEEEFAKYCGTDYAISTSSGTDALQFSLFASEVKGREVISCPTSFIATSNSIVNSGADVVFADADYESNNIEPSLIEDKITEKTKAIIPIHLYGNPADMERINEIAEKRNIAVIEDACQAHGATHKGKKAGNLGTVGCFSFYSTKNITVGGDGGMITTNEEKIANRISKMRNCGRISQYEHDEFGYTARLNSVNAAIGRVQLKRLDGWNEKRNATAKKYMEELKDIDGISLPKIPEHNKSAFHLFACKTDKRDELFAYLKEKGIQAGTHYPIPIHLQPLYVKLFGYRKGDYPVSEKISEKVICLPMFSEIKDEELDYVIETVRRFFD